MRSKIFDQAFRNLVDERKKHKWRPKPDTTGGGTGGQNVMCGAVFSDGQSKTNFYPCHAPIKQYKNALALWSAFGYRTTEAVARDYFNWLIVDSPWAMTGIVPKELSPEEMFSEGFVFTDLDQVPANLLHNFLIASRMAAEWPKFIEDWWKMVYERSVHPSFAFLMLTAFRTDDYMSQETPFRKKSQVTWMDKYDWPLDIGRATEEYILNFLSGKTPGLSKKMFSPDAVTEPVNTLWGPLLPLKHKDCYVQSLTERYKSLGVLEELPGSFNTQKVLTFTPIQGFLAVVLEEQKRLGLDVSISHSRRAA